MTVRAADLDLPTRRDGLTELAGDQPANAETDPEERRVAALPRTLRQALPRADHRRARRILLEAAGQLRVLDVFEEGLELLLVLGLERDREITEPDDLQAVAVDVALDLGDRFRFDLIGMRGDAEQRPAAADDMRDDVGTQRLEQLLPHPVGDFVIG